MLWGVGEFRDAYALQRRSVMIPVGFPKGRPEEAILWIRQSAFDRGEDGGVIRISTRKTSLRLTPGTVLRSEEDLLLADRLESYPKPEGGDAVKYWADRDGELAFAVTVKDGLKTLHWMKDKRWERSPANLQWIDIAGPGDAPGELWVMFQQESGKPFALHRFDARTGQIGDRLHQDPKYDVDDARLHRHPADGRLLGVHYVRKSPQSVWFDPTYTAIQAAMQAGFPQDAVNILAGDRTDKIFLLRVASDVRPPVYYVFDREKNTAAPLAETRPWIDPQRMRPMRQIAYPTRDGFQVEAYLTLPEGASVEKPAPMVVLPHGGPHVRDSWAWDPEVQFLASRGYAVFQPNYRGSTGYAWRFPEKDQWAFRKMHDDVTDGVKTLLKTGLIDRDRVAIMGTSFGGYLALCGAAFEKSVYRCAVTVAGVFDWQRVIQEAERSRNRRVVSGTLRRYLGDPMTSEETFNAMSPLRHVRQISIPVYVAHGTEDAVASVAQSRQLLAELKKHGVPHEKQIEREEGHGFHKLENRLELYAGIEAFLATHLAPRVTVAGTGGAKP
jgi:dipeptidyl aminopeptidase/acylaminoacyl peptidase